MNPTKLTIKSHSSTFPDAAGTWNRKDVLKEMFELGIDLENQNSWIEYVLDRAFDGALDGKVQNVLVENDDAVMLKVKVGNDVFTIEKEVVI